MTGSDLAVMYHDDETNTPHVEDYHATGNAFPTLDSSSGSAYCSEADWVPADGQQNWLAFSSFQNDTHTSVIVGRLLDTGDAMDWPIINDGFPTRLLFSYGQSDTLDYHGTNRGTFRVNFFDDLSGTPYVYDPLADLKADPNVRTHFFSNDKFAIPSNTRTTYYDKYMSLDNTDIQIVGFEHVLDENTVDLVHHFVLTAEMDGNAEGSIIWPWAAGVQPFAFPDDVGFHVGGDTGYVGLNMNTHYDNPERKSGLKDESGILIYYVEMEHFRPLEAGIFSVGDPNVWLFPTPIPEGISSWHITCPESCTRSVLEEKVTIMTVQLHMHAVGRAIMVEHKRDGEVINSWTVEFYDYAFQDVVPISETMGVEILPGDTFDTTCVFKNEGRFVKYGPGSNDEMCMSFILYYPKVEDLTECGITSDYRCLGDVSDEKDMTEDDITFRTFLKEREGDDASCVALSSFVAEPNPLNAVDDEDEEIDDAVLTLGGSSYMLHITWATFLSSAITSILLIASKI